MIFLGIGSNLNSSYGDRFQNIRKTLSLILLKKIKINKVSSFYESPSYPDSSKPSFINIVINIDYKNGPKDLLKEISIIEKSLGRVRKIKNEPRTCDIDIIDFNGIVIEDETLVLPHPKADKRNFVLYPLKEIKDNWIHPINNKKINDLIDNLDFKTSNEITRLTESVILDT